MELSIKCPSCSSLNNLNFPHNKIEFTCHNCKKKFRITIQELNTYICRICNNEFISTEPNIGTDHYCQSCLLKEYNWRK